MKIRQDFVDKLNGMTKILGVLIQKDIAKTVRNIERIRKVSNG